MGDVECRPCGACAGRAVTDEQPAKATIRARIRVAVWPDGTWIAYGDEGKNAVRMHDDILDACPGGESYYWVEADLPMPTTIKGEVVQ